MSKLRSVFVGVALVAGSLAGMASAAVMQATWRGTVSEGSIDRTNLFGAGSSVDGLAFKAVFTYDPETPGASRTTTSTIDEAVGGTRWGVPSPMRSVMFTINGHTESFNPSFSAYIQSINGPIFSQTLQSGVYSRQLQNRKFTWSAVGASGRILSPVFPASLDSSVPLTSLGRPGTRGLGSFAFCAITGPGGCTTDIGTHGRLLPTSVKIAPIPLPAALPLLASGLAGLGFVAFRRGRKGQAAA